MLSKSLLLVLCIVGGGATLLGCVAHVGQARRGRLADPMMALAPDPTETYAAQKLHTSREAAAGGDGAAAGGGCACQ